MRIAVVGSLNMDLTVTTERLPNKGETLLGQSLHTIPGGKGANQACAIGRLGGDVTMFGCVGDDDFGHQLIQSLQDNGVHTSPIRCISGIPTGIALITVGESDNTIIVVPGANHQVDETYLRTVQDELLTFDLVLLQLEIPMATVAAVCQLCHEHDIDVLLNPAPAQPLPERVLRQIRYLTPNEHEAALLLPDNGSMEERVQQMPGRLIITLGAEGSLAADHDGRLIRTPAAPARVVDTTGAGDTCNGAFAYATAIGLPLREALRFASTAASISTEQLGAQGGMPTRTQVEARLRADA